MTFCQIRFQFAASSYHVQYQLYGTYKSRQLGNTSKYQKHTMVLSSRKSAILIFKHSNAILDDGLFYHTQVEYKVTSTARIIWPFRYKLLIALNIYIYIYIYEWYVPIALRQYLYTQQLFQLLSATSDLKQYGKNYLAGTKRHSMLHCLISTNKYYQGKLSFPIRIDFSTGKALFRNVH